MLTIDGSMGEGGGQILRSALALALCQQRGFRILNIRARRPRPGLRPQHLAAVRAAADISRAQVEGAVLGSQTLTFIPGQVRAGCYHFSTGTAGSACLVLQTVLPALLTAKGSTELRLEGGTHNPRAPTFEYLARAYLPLIERMGPRIEIDLVRAGFEPAGGGCILARIQPVIGHLEPLFIDTRGRLQGLEAEVLLSKLPSHIAEREAAVIADALPIDRGSIRQRVVDDSPGPGNVVTVIVLFEQVTEVFAGFGRRALPAESVAQGVAERVARYLASKAPIGVHLADQLILPLALAGVGSFTTQPPSAHTLTNIRVIQEFLPLNITCTATTEPGSWKLEVGRPNLRLDRIRQRG
jgi:RNA 3'-terminal phosphate cyclase (ATP)